MATSIIFTLTIYRNTECRVLNYTKIMEKVYPIKTMINPTAQRTVCRYESPYANLYETLYATAHRHFLISPTIRMSLSKVKIIENRGKKECFSPLFYKNNT